jgi:hypothetical protein
MERIPRMAVIPGRKVCIAPRCLNGCWGHPKEGSLSVKHALPLKSGVLMFGTSSAPSGAALRVRATASLSSLPSVESTGHSTFGPFAGGLNSRAHLGCRKGSHEIKAPTNWARMKQRSEVGGRRSVNFVSNFVGSFVGNFVGNPESDWLFSAIWSRLADPGRTTGTD